MDGRRPLNFMEGTAMDRIDIDIELWHYVVIQIRKPNN